MPAPTHSQLIDRVDEHDRVVGRVARGRALRDGVNFRTVHVFVRDAGGDLLLQRLGSQRERHAARWGSSVAAYPHAGERPAVAAARRLREELGLDAALSAWGTIAVPEGESTKFVTLFEASSDGGTVREPGHVEALRHWPIAELERHIATDSSEFTPTFVALFAAWRSAA